MESLSKSREKSVSMGLTALAGGISGMLMESILHPMDTIRTRLKANA